MLLILSVTSKVHQHYSINMNFKIKISTCRFKPTPVTAVTRCMKLSMEYVNCVTWMLTLCTNKSGHYLTYISYFSVNCDQCISLVFSSESPRYIFISMKCSYCHIFMKPVLHVPVLYNKIEK